MNHFWNGFVAGFCGSAIFLLMAVYFMRLLELVYLWGLQ